MLRHPQDAEDAFQAVFLALSTQAKTLRRVRTLAGWLHNVSVKVGFKLLRGNQRRRKTLESAARNVEDRRPPCPDLCRALDEEIAALPARQREAIVLCELQGLTRQETATQLNAPVATIGTWLARGRRTLRERLVKRGVSLGAGSVAAAAARWGEAAPTVPAELAQQTVRQAQLFLTGMKASTVQATQASLLAEGVIRTMFLSKLSTTVGIVALAAALVLGVVPMSGGLGWLSGTKAGEPFQTGAPFRDDFEDGSATDGMPVTWEPTAIVSNGTYRVENGSFVLRPTVAGGGLLSLARGVDAKDVSLRTQLRSIGSSEGMSLFARFDLTQGTFKGTYQGGIDSTGLAYIVWNDAQLQVHDLDLIQTSFRPANEDVVVQFDVFGDSLSLYVWRPDEPMPTTPLLTVNDDRFSAAGRIGILTDTAGVGGGIFRYVEASNFPLPEPSSAALGSLGAVSLFCFALRARLGRVRFKRG